MSPLNEQVSLCFKSCNSIIYLWYILYYIAAPVAGANQNITFDLGEDLMLTTFFSDFNLALDGITWTQNSSTSLMNGIDDVTITISLGPPDATSTLTRPGITGVSHAGTYVATATNRAGSDTTTFTVTITTGMTVWNVFF